MYVVRRPFRNKGVVLLPGMRVEAADIKRFKNKLAERKIIEVTADTMHYWNEYYIKKFGVVLVPESVPEPKPEPKLEPKPEPKPELKAVPKAVPEKARVTAKAK